VGSKVHESEGIGFAVMGCLPYALVSGKLAPRVRYTVTFSVYSLANSDGKLNNFGRYQASAIASEQRR
jgi:hypothetical protein